MRYLLYPLSILIVSLCLHSNTYKDTFWLSSEFDDNGEFYYYIFHLKDTEVDFIMVDKNFQEITTLSKKAVKYHNQSDDRVIFKSDYLHYLIEFAGDRKAVFRNMAPEFGLEKVIPVKRISNDDFSSIVRNFGNVESLAIHEEFIKMSRELSKDDLELIIRSENSSNPNKIGTNH